MAGTTADRIRHVKLSTLTLPLEVPISDAKVLTGRQKPMTEIVFLFAEIATEQASTGSGSATPSGPVARRSTRMPGRSPTTLIGEDPIDIGKIYDQAALGRRVGRSQRRGHPGDRGHRHRAVRPQGQARRPAAGEAARGVPRLGADVQHLRRLPARADRGGQGAGHPVAGRGDRRDQDQGRSAGHRDRPGAGDRGPRASGRRRAADGRRQPAVGPADGAAVRPRARAVRTGLDRGAAGRVRRRGPRPARGCARHADRDRRDAVQRRASTSL